MNDKNCVDFYLLQKIINHKLFESNLITSIQQWNSLECEEIIKNKIYYKVEKIQMYPEIFMTVCQLGDKHIFDFFLEYGYDNYINASLYWACKHNFNTFLPFLLTHPYTDCNRALQGACSGGHIQLVKCILERFKTIISLKAVDWQSASIHIGWGGNIDILNLVMNYGPINMDLIITCSCEKGHVKMASYVKDLYQIKDCAWKQGLERACGNQQTDVIDFIFEEIANKNISLTYLDCFTILNITGKHGSPKVFKLLFSFFNKHYIHISKLMISAALQCAHEKNNLDNIHFLQEILMNLQ